MISGTIDIPASNYYIKRNGQSFRCFFGVLLAMSVGKKFDVGDSPTESWESKFKHYLDGYFDSFDFYPVCERHLFKRNDAYALWIDFIQIASDLSDSTTELVSHPERFSSREATQDDEFEKQKRQVAEQTLRRLLERAAEQQSYTSGN